MKILPMPVQPRRSLHHATRAERHVRAARKGMKLLIFVVAALTVGILATLLLAGVLALALAVIVAAAAGIVAATGFLFVSPEGNLLLLLLLSQLWLLYAPHKSDTARPPHGGLTIKPARVVEGPPRSLAA